jgi:hypothetical protein
MDHRRGSWGSAKELGYQECIKKQAACQFVGVKPQPQEQSGRLRASEASPSECQAGRLRGDKSAGSPQTKESRGGAGGGGMADCVPY